MNIAKYTLKVPVSVLLFLLLIVAPVFSQYGGGSGTAEDINQIATTDDLIELCNTSADWDKDFMQSADIECNADETQVDWNGVGTPDGENPAGFSPIGTTGSGNDFTGNYNGNGFIIKNLYIDRAGVLNQALFGYIRSGRIEKVGIIDADSTRRNNVAILVETSCGRVERSFVTGRMEAT